MEGRERRHDDGAEARLVEGSLSLMNNRCAGGGDEAVDQLVAFVPVDFAPLERAGDARRQTFALGDVEHDLRNEPRAGSSPSSRVSSCLSFAAPTQITEVPCSPFRTVPPASLAWLKVRKRGSAHPMASLRAHNRRTLTPLYGRPVIALRGAPSERCDHRCRHGATPPGAIARGSVR